MNARSTSARLRAEVEAFLRAHANLIFSGAPGVGAMVVLATLTEPRFFLLDLCSVAGAHFAARALGIGMSTGYSPYGYNAVLVGLFVAHGHALGGASSVLAALLGAASVFVTAALTSWLGGLAGVPVLSMPFLVTSTLAQGVLPYLSLSTPVSRAAPAAGLPTALALALDSFGSILFLPKALAGAVVLAALLVHSRIAVALAGGGIALTFGLSALAHVPLAERLMLAAAFNATLSAIAVGGVWFVPSRASYVLSLGAALLAVFFTLGLSAPFARLGLPLLVLPFNATVLLILLAARQRAGEGQLHAADLLSPTPEASLLAFRAKRLRAGRYGASFRLPFAAPGPARKGSTAPLPTRIYGDTDSISRCTLAVTGRFASARGRGSRITIASAFPCSPPLTAPSSGSRTRHSTMRSAEIDEKAPWGNRVTLQHGHGLFSTVAHLARGSVAVKLGHFVRAGELLGHCGNSGRSPRPHLHFQLQSAVAMTSPTLPCRFAQTVVRSPSFEQLASEIEPREGLVLRNVEPDAAIATYFQFSVGKTAACLAGGTTEHLDCDVDAWGRLLLRSRELGASLVFECREDGFSSHEVTGSAASALYLLRVALARVPFETGVSVNWKDSLPRPWLMNWSGGAPLEIAALFDRERDVEMAYVRREEGHRLVIEGASAEKRRGAPLVRTRAVFERAGLALVEVTVGRRTRRASAPKRPIDVPPRPQRGVSEAALSAARPLERRLGEGP